MENDKKNWRNAFFSSIALTIGSLLVMAVQNPEGNPFNWEVYFLIQPILWLLMFSLPITIELISKIQKRGKDDNISEGSRMSKV